MTTTLATAPLEIAPPRRRRWPWVVAVFLAPFVILGGMAASCLSLDADAVALRQDMMRATRFPWKTKVQISVGRLTLGGVRTALNFVEHPEAEKARLALRAVRRASVGVYRRDMVERDVAFDQLLARTDRAMQRRGWSRIVGVSEEGNVVLAYGPNNGSGRAMEICLAVMKERELVLVSASVDADAIADFARQYLSEEFSRTFPRRRTAAHGAAASVAR